MQIAEILAEMKNRPELQEPPLENLRRRASGILRRLRDDEGLDMEPRECFVRVIKHASALGLAQENGWQKPEKGLILFGQVGCGKTTLVRRAYVNTRMKYFTAGRVISDFLEYEDSFSTDRKYYSNQDVILDDLGAEPEKVQRFGTTFGLGEFLQWRYDCFKRNGVLTVITTNLPGPQEVTQVYGARITSRIREMCEPVLYRHGDRRM